MKRPPRGRSPKTSAARPLALRELSLLRPHILHVLITGEPLTSRLAARLPRLALTPLHGKDTARLPSQRRLLPEARVCFSGLAGTGGEKEREEKKPLNILTAVEISER